MRTDLKVFGIAVLALFLLATMAKAEYVCKPVGIAVYGNVLSEYPMGDATFEILSSGISVGERLDAILTYPDGLEEQKTAFLDADKKATFTFDLNQAGGYELKAWTIHPATGAEIPSEIYEFRVKASMDVDFTIEDPVQYTVRDMKLKLVVKDPDGKGIERPSIQLSTEVMGIPKILTSVEWNYLGLGEFEISVPKENLREGTMDITVEVSDPEGRFDPVAMNILGIDIRKPAISVEISTPTKVQCGDVVNLKVITKDYTGTALDVDKVTLTVKHPNGIDKDVFTEKDMIRTAAGNYQYTYEFILGPNYQLMATAKMLDRSYLDGAVDPKPIVVVEGCSQTFCENAICGTSGDGCCPIGCTHKEDLDCEREIEEIPWLVYIAIAVVGIGIVAFVLSRIRR